MGNSLKVKIIHRHWSFVTEYSKGCTWTIRVPSVSPSSLPSQLLSPIRTVREDFSNFPGRENQLRHLLKVDSVKVTQSCPTLCNPMDYTVHGILQVRMLEWVAFPFSRGSSQPRDQTQVSHIAGGFFTS